MFGDFEIETTDNTVTTDDGGPAEASVAEMVVARNGKYAEFVVENAI